MLVRSLILILAVASGASWLGPAARASAKPRTYRFVEHQLRDTISRVPAKGQLLFDATNDRVVEYSDEIFVLHEPALASATRPRLIIETETTVVPHPESHLVALFERGRYRIFDLEAHDWWQNRSVPALREVTPLPGERKFVISTERGYEIHGKTIEKLPESIRRPIRTKVLPSVVTSDGKYLVEVLKGAVRFVPLRGNEEPIVVTSDARAEKWIDAWAVAPSTNGSEAVIIAEDGIFEASATRQKRWKRADHRNLEHAESVEAQYSKAGVLIHAKAHGLSWAGLYSFDKKELVEQRTFAPSLDGIAMDSSGEALFVVQKGTLWKTGWKLEDDVPPPFVTDAPFTPSFGDSGEIDFGSSATSLDSGARARKLPAPVPLVENRDFAIFRTANAIVRWNRRTGEDDRLFRIKSKQRFRIRSTAPKRSFHVSVLSQNGRFVAIVDEKNRVRIHDLKREDTDILEVRAGAAIVNSDGEALLAVRSETLDDHGQRMWRISLRKRNGDEKWGVDVPADHPGGAAFSRDEERVYTRVGVFRTRDGSKIRAFDLEKVQHPHRFRTSTRCDQVIRQNGREFELLSKDGDTLAALDLAATELICDFTEDAKTVLLRNRLMKRR